MPQTNYDTMNTFDTSLSVTEINQMRNRLIENISELNLKKARIDPHNFNLLSNYHQYSLNVLNNMIQLKAVEEMNPYNVNLHNYSNKDYTLNPYTGAKNVIQYQNGTEVITTRHLAESNNEEWMNQFNESLLLNPPSYLMPPKNVYDISKIKNITKPQKLQ